LALPSSLLSFFFQRHLTNPDLHSFPTRRSSDLRQGFPGIAGRQYCGVAQQPGRNRISEQVPERDTGGAGQAAHSIHRILFLLQRSEEHTSELQSRENLVCRLLLEKKNKKKEHHY